VPRGLSLRLLSGHRVICHSETELLLLLLLALLLTLKRCVQLPSEHRQAASCNHRHLAEL